MPIAAAAAVRPMCRVDLSCRILTMDTKAGRLHAVHSGIEGLLLPGEIDLLMAPESLAALVPGARLLTRIVPVPKGWQVVELRSLGTPAGR